MVIFVVVVVVRLFRYYVNLNWVLEGFMMDSTDLQVKVSKELEGLLSNWFDPNRRVREGAIYKINNVPCPLCEAYYIRGSGCGECPLADFEKNKRHGCTRWLDRVLRESGISEFIPELHAKFVCWPIWNDTEACNQLLKLREATEHYIKWVWRFIDIGAM